MIEGRLKNFFFDTPAVMRKTNDATRRVLSKMGAFIRKAARDSLVYRKSKSSAGSPPSVHRSEGFKRKNKKGVRRATSPFKELIYFGYDDSKRSVVIGPEVFRNAVGKPGMATDVEEHGGTETITLPNGKSVTAHYPARPTMGPAMKEELPKLPGMWADSIK